MVQNCEIVMKQSIYGYHGDQKSPYIRVTVSDPRNISKCRLKIEGGVTVPGLSRPCQADTTFESNLGYALRFMIDCKVSGCNWIELPAGTYSYVRNGASLAQIEVETTLVLYYFYYLSIPFTDFKNYMIDMIRLSVMRLKVNGLI